VLARHRKHNLVRRFAIKTYIGHFFSAFTGFQLANAVVVGGAWGVKLFEVGRGSVGSGRPCSE